MIKEIINGAIKFFSPESETPLGKYLCYASCRNCLSYESKVFVPIGISKMDYEKTLKNRCPRCGVSDRWILFSPQP